MNELPQLRQRESELVAKIKGRTAEQRSTNMGFTKYQYEKAATQFLEQNADLALKYMHPQLLATLVEWMKESLPTTVSAKLAFDRLVEEGVLQRTDSGNEETDRAGAAEKARATIRKIEEEVGSQALDRETYEYIASLSPRELSRLYFGEDGSAINEFAIVYRRAMKEWGFREPLRFNDTPAAPAWADGL